MGKEARRPCLTHFCNALTALFRPPWIIFLSILMLVCCSSQGANNKQCTTQAAHRHWRFLAAPAPRFQAAELPGSHLLTPSFLSEQMETQEQEPRARRGHLCLSYSNYWSCNCRVVTHTNTHTVSLVSSLLNSTARDHLSTSQHFYKQGLSPEVALVSDGLCGDFHPALG